MKTVQNVKNSLKFKAAEKEGVLSIKLGVKKYTVPVKARLISSDQFLFLSFPASSELYRIDKKSLNVMDRDEDASEAYEKLSVVRPRGTRGRRASSGPMPDELAKALSNVPNGFKIGYGPDGSPRLVKSRTRRKKSA
ncbi:MAG: hypothetical protein SFX74_06120 [Fimbriimonadaceae bacterium]|nr:hypothetical protein [Fimbriimonadaceae bacterium]